LNISQFVGFQYFPEWIQNEKVVETLAFDGKEQLFSKRTMGISKSTIHFFVDDCLGPLFTTVGTIGH